MPIGPLHKVYEVRSGQPTLSCYHRVAHRVAESVRIFPTFGDLSRDSQIIRCYLHHDRYLITVMRSQKRLEPLANFHADAPSADRARRVTTLRHHFVINAVIVSLLSGAEGSLAGI